MSEAVLFERHRSSLIRLAYRITGSVCEAEDIVHETFLRWLDADRQEIVSPYSWLVTVATRLSLDYLKSAAVKRQTYIGPWLPEPFIEDRDKPDASHELDESVAMALLVLLDRLSPTERAAYILHDLFHFDFDEIGVILGKSGASCRKLGSRARLRIEQGNARRKPDRREYEKVVQAFFGAVKTGEVKQLVAVLQDNVIFHSDGGGKAVAAPEIMRGVEQVANFIIKHISAASGESGQQIRQVWFNGAPGYVVWSAGEPVSAFNFEVEAGRVSKIHVLRNPDKLSAFKAVPGAGAVRLTLSE